MKRATKTSSSPDVRPVILDRLGADLEELAHGVGVRSAGNGPILRAKQSDDPAGEARGLLMRRMWPLVALLAFWPRPGLAQTIDELVNDGKNTENVTTQSMGYDRKSYSPLNQINTSNIRRLVPIWSTSLMNDM